MAAPTPEQLRQRIGAVSLARFLAMPEAEQSERLAGWRLDAEARANHAGPLIRLDARARLRRCAEWSAAAELAAAGAEA